MLPNTVSTMTSARFFVRPATWATCSTSAAFVRLPSVTGWSIVGSTRRGRRRPATTLCGAMIAAARRWSRRSPERPRHRGRKDISGPSHGRAHATPPAPAGRRASPTTRGRRKPRCGESAVSAPPGRSGATPPALPRAGLRRARTLPKTQEVAQKTPFFLREKGFGRWRARQDSNLWPSAPEADARSSLS